MSSDLWDSRSFYRRLVLEFKLHDTDARSHWLLRQLRNAKPRVTFYKSLAEFTYVKV